MKLSAIWLLSFPLWRSLCGVFHSDQTHFYFLLIMGSVAIFWCVDDSLPDRCSVTSNDFGWFVVPGWLACQTLSVYLLGVSMLSLRNVYSVHCLFLIDCEK